MGGRAVRRDYNQRGETRFCALRYYNAFGPNQSLYPIRKIIPMFAALAMRGRPLEVFGDGEQVVDLVYSPDRSPPAKVRAMVDFLVAAFNPRPPWDLD